MTVKGTVRYCGGDHKEGRNDRSLINVVSRGCGSLSSDTEATRQIERRASMHHTRINRGRRVILVWQCSWSLGIPLYWRGADLAVTVVAQIYPRAPWQSLLSAGLRGRFLAVRPIGVAPVEGAAS